jgi:hypothetical protein
MILMVKVGLQKLENFDRWFKDCKKKWPTLALIISIIYTEVIMLDVTGREVRPGSFILYINKHYFDASLHPAMVLKINKKSLRVSISGYDRYNTEETGIAKRIPLCAEQLYVIEDVPNLKGAFKTEVARIAKYCLENEKLPDDVKENCIYLLGALS